MVTTVSYSAKPNTDFFFLLLEKAKLPRTLKPLRMLAPKCGFLPLHALSLPSPGTWEKINPSELVLLL